MRIWVHGDWFEVSHNILVVQLTDQDKKNIADMHPDCDLYCSYDEEYKEDYVIELLTKLKKEKTVTV